MIQMLSGCPAALGEGGHNGGKRTMRPPGPAPDSVLAERGGAVFNAIQSLPNPGAWSA